MRRLLVVLLFASCKTATPQPQPSSEVAEVRAPDVVVDEDAAVYEVDGKGTARLRDGDSGSDAA